MHPGWVSRRILRSTLWTVRSILTGATGEGALDVADPTLGAFAAALFPLAFACSNAVAARSAATSLSTDDGIAIGAGWPAIRLAIDRVGRSVRKAMTI